MWTDENRTRYDRSKLRHPSDLTDEEWALVKPEIPRAKRGATSVRSIFARFSTSLRTLIEHRLPMAYNAKGSASPQHGQLLLLPLAA